VKKTEKDGAITSKKASRQSSVSPRRGGAREFGGKKMQKKLISKLQRNSDPRKFTSKGQAKRSGAARQGREKKRRQRATYKKKAPSSAAKESHQEGAIAIRAQGKGLNNCVI